MYRDLHQPRKQIVHRHIHHHYHYEGLRAFNVDSDYQLPSKGISSRANKIKCQHCFKLDQGDINPNLSWRNHINAEVNKLYDQLRSRSSSINDYRFNHQKHRLRCNFSKGQKNRNYSQATRPVSKSKVDLERNIQQYEQYLKERQRTNLFVPKSRSTESLAKNITENTLSNKINFYDKNAADYRTFQGLKEKNTGSRMRTSRHLETVPDKKASYSSRVMNPKQQYYQTFVSQNKEYLKANKPTLQHQSEKKVKCFNLVQNHINQIDKYPIKTGSEGQKQKDEQHTLSQTENFIEYKKIRSSHNLPKNSQLKENSKVQRVPSLSTTEAQSIFLSPTNTQDISYKYKLLEQECIFLRNAFMNHVQKNHNTKL